MTRAGLRGPADGWSAFWFAPTDAAPLAAVRIAFAVVTVAWTLSLAPDLGPFFTPEGITGRVRPDEDVWNWTLLGLVDSAYAVALLYLLLLAAAVTLLVGWHARISAAVVFLALTSFERVNPYVFNSGDTLLRLLAFYVMVAPSGAT